MVSDSLETMRDLTVWGDGGCSPPLKEQQAWDGYISAVGEVREF